MLGAFSELVAQLKRRFARKDISKTPSKEDRDFVLAACQTWFSEHTRAIQLLGVPAETVVALNGRFGDLLRLAGTSRRRVLYMGNIQEIQKMLDGFYADAQVVEWQQERGSVANHQTSGTQDQVLDLLNSVDADLATRYRQVIQDLSEVGRVSYTGTAGELREILRIVLHTKAPEEEVRKKEWFIQKRESTNNDDEKKRGPTHAERVRYILETQRHTSQKDLTNAQANQELVDAILGQVARSAYDRMSAKVHGGNDKKEIIRSLQYINALLADLLPGEEIQTLSSEG